MRQTRLFKGQKETNTDKRAMDEIKAKQQVVAKIKESTKILVTVSDSPSVDALSAAIGLTMLLDKQEKYATAIFSGQTPPAIAFLEPEKTFDDTTDSLRDFIIALNKEKADHLRYKVEGDAVKIFITPYKTTIDQSDLEFSQGDYNVELVIALGVDNQDHLDGALENHGQILHDAAIITITAGDQTSDLGGIDWHDAGASSLSEMVTGLAEAMKEDKKKSLLDESISTALLTGIVAETDRFSNQHTTSKTLTVAASLMSAGADQQLIANELQAMHEVVETSKEDEEEIDDTTADLEDASNDDDTAETTTDSDGTMTIKQPKQPKDGLNISHDGESLADLDRRIRGDEEAKELVTEEVEAAQERAAKEAHPQIKPAKAEVPVEPVASTAAAYALPDDVVEPTLGGTLNATTDQAADDARRAAENDQNKTILSHSYLGGATDTTPGSVGVNDTEAPRQENEVHSAYALDETPAEEAPVDQPPEAAGVGGERVIQPLEAQPAPEPAPVMSIPDPVPAPTTPTDLGLPLPPPIPDFSQGLPAAPSVAIPLPPTEQPAILGDILAPEVSGTGLPPVESIEPVAPVLPDVPAVNPVEQQPAQAPTPPPTQPNDPTQFQIPPQPNA